MKTCLQPCIKLYCKSESRRYGKTIANSFATHIARMNFSLKTYCCELFNLIGMVGKVELISTFTTAVYQSWNVSDKYTWDNAGDLKQLSIDETVSEGHRND